MVEVPLDIVLSDPLTQTPSLVLDLETISETYNHFTNLFPDGLVYYAMKANANPQIIQLILNKQGGMEIASASELARALEAGASGDQIICSNPIKHPDFIKKMRDVGVYAMVADSTYEIEKIAEYAPGCRIYIRLSVDNTGSVLPLAGKFGVDGDLALALFDQARELGLQPIGLSFHVGSQCLSPFNWVNAIRACGNVWKEANKRGHDLYFLDIGGGFPVGHYHDQTIPTLETISQGVIGAVEDFIPYHPNFMLILEPGRGLVGESGRLIASVVGKAERGESTWLYLDVGVFNGLMETFEGFPPVVRLLNDIGQNRPIKRYTIAGPSCDSCDVVVRDILMPEIHINDRLVFYDMGAYTNEYAAAFNGFPVPSEILLNTEIIQQQYTPSWLLARTS